MTEAQAVIQLPKLQGQLPKLGTPMEGGKYAGVLTDNDGQLYALVLLDAKPAERLKWKDAVAWAKTLDAELPNRVESAQLFRALKSEFEPKWHWTSETCDFDASFAWYCYFGIGFQGSNVKSYAGCARAVRRIAL